MNQIPDSNKKDSLVYIIILNYNSTEDTLECLNSLAEIDYDNYKIIIIDNASDISCDQLVRARFPSVMVVNSSKNLGFAGGCNLGITVAMQEKANYIWLLNNDTTVDRGALKALVREAAKDRKCGMVGSKIITFGTNVIQTAGGRVFPFLLFHGWTKGIGKGEIDAGQHDIVKQVAFTTGCSLLIKTEVIKTIGAMDERFFLYFEETDWCVRARKNGWVVKYVYDSVVYHKGSQSVGGGSPLQNYYCIRNALLFMSKHYPYFIFSVLYWWPRYFCFNHKIHKRTTHLKYCLKAIQDFVSKDFGPIKFNEEEHRG